MSTRHSLDRVLSKAGVCSRQQAAVWIAGGRITVNGATVLDPGAWVDPDGDRVAIDGRQLHVAEKLYYALHKPRGFMTTRADPRGRPTVYDLLGDLMPG